MTDPEHRLMAYVDGELDPDAAREVERLLETDAGARASVDMFRDTALRLRSACGEATYAAQPERFLGHTTSRRVRQTRRWALAAAACVGFTLLGFGAANQLRSESPASDFLGEIAEYHEVYSKETTHLVEVPAEQEAHLVAWLGERIGQRIVVPDLSAASLRFAGGRMLVVDGRPVAELMYTRANGSPVGLCVVRADGAPRPLTTTRRGELRLAAWQDAHGSYVIVGDLDGAALRDLAKRTAAQIVG